MFVFYVIDSNSVTGGSFVFDAAWGFYMNQNEEAKSLAFRRGSEVSQGKPPPQTPNPKPQTLNPKP